MTYLLAQASAHRLPLRDESVQTCITSLIRLVKGGPQ